MIYSLSESMYQTYSPMPPSRAIRHMGAIHLHIPCTSRSRRQMCLYNTLLLTSARNNPNPYS